MTTHFIRDMTTHLKNTWQWDAWGFTKNWGNCTMSDIDGFVPFFAERKGQFLIVEMKHWDGTGDQPQINMNSGQAIALWELSKQPNFTIMLGYGDTSTRIVHAYEVWHNGGRWDGIQDFQESLDQWFNQASKGGVKEWIG